LTGLIAVPVEGEVCASRDLRSDNGSHSA
jgi:hypothetical protein